MKIGSIPKNIQTQNKPSINTKPSINNTNCAVTLIKHQNQLTNYELAKNKEEYTPKLHLHCNELIKEMKGYLGNGLSNENETEVNELLTKIKQFYDGTNIDLPCFFDKQI